MIKTDLVGKEKVLNMSQKHKLFINLDSGVLFSRDAVSKKLHPLIDEMLQRGIILREKPKGSRKFKYIVNNDNLFKAMTKKHFPGGLYSTEFDNDSRESAAIRERDSKKTSRKVDSSLILKVFTDQNKEMSELVKATEKHGLCAIDIATSNFLASGRWVSIENHESFHVICKENSKNFDGAVLLSGNPSSKRIQWMKESSENGCFFTHFGDLDFFGLEHFSAIENSLGDSVDLWNSEKITVDFFRKNGDKDLFDKQKSEANLQKINRVIGKNQNASDIYSNIIKSGNCIHQEMIHSFFFETD